MDKEHANIWVRESRDKKGYSMFYNMKPARLAGEAVYFIGKVYSEEQSKKLSRLNGRASIFELIQFCKNYVK